jgi:aspartate-semialdehyde dehydrogenase
MERNSVVKPNFWGKSEFVVGVLGATGLVGRQIIQTLEVRKFPVSRLRPLASPNSAGQMIEFAGGVELVTEPDPDLFGTMDFLLASAGREVSRHYAPLAAQAGCVFIDNSSAWRLDPEVPLVVPEVNPEALAAHQGIIANPNCSTIQMVMALKPLHDLARLRRVVVSTYQSVSGKGKAAMDELFDQLQALLTFQTPEVRAFPHRIQSNCLPHIGPFDAAGNSEEELKMVNETHKILDPKIAVAVTTVRVPVFIGHAESLAAEFEREIDVAAARAALAAFPGVIVEDEPAADHYPLPSNSVGRDEVLVGRLRRDPTVEHGLLLWVVADNLLKGAALNAVQIAETLIRQEGAA